MGKVNIVQSGKIILDGKIKYGNINVSGKILCNEVLECDNISVDGKANFPLGINAKDKILMSGKMSTSDIICSEFYGKGSLYVGSLSAKECSLVVSSESKIKAAKINGSFNISFKNQTDFENEIAQKVANLLSIDFGTIGFKDARLTINTIYADKVFLSHTDAEYVEAREIVLGESCHIDKVVYRDKFESSHDSIVTEIIRR